MFNKDITYNDASMYLRHTYIKYKGRLVYVQDVSAFGKSIDLRLKDVRSEKEFICNVNSTLLDFKVGHVGYINYKNGCTYFVRRPFRTCKQGLRLEREVSGDAANSLLGKYPKFKDAYSKARSTNTKVAFNKNFAVGYDDVLYYKGNVVGYYAKSDGIKMLSSFKFLLPKIKEAINV